MSFHGLARYLAVLAIAFSTFSSFAPALAQDEEEIDTDSLLAIDLEPGALPEVPAFIRLVRITLEPGAVSPEHTHPGPEFGRIESGVVTVQVAGPAKIKQRSAKADDPYEDAQQGTAISLDRGDQIYYPAGTPLTFRNDGEEQASLLALVILPAASEDEDGPELIDYTGDEPTEDAFKGLSSKILGDGIATTLPTGGSRITILRVKLNEGQSLPGSRNPMLYSVTSGDCAFTVIGGSVQISRTREPGPQNDTEAGTEVELKPGDAMFFPNGIRTTGRGENSDDLDLIQVIVAPTDTSERLSEASRGQIKFVQPESPPEEDDQDRAERENRSDSEPDVQFAEGSSVFVNSTDVNLRDAPTTSGGQVTVLIYGQELIVTGGPEEGDGITWWPVTIAADESISGWVSQEFIQSDPVE